MFSFQYQSHSVVRMKWGGLEAEEAVDRRLKCPLVTMEDEPLGMEAKQLAQEDKQLICDKVEELKYWECF